MKKIQLPKISESFPARLSFLLILITSAVFIVSFIAYYQSARIQVKSEAVQHAERSLETVVLRIDQVLQSVEIAVNNMTWNVNEYINTPDSLYSLTTQLLKNNSHIVGSAIAFEPKYFPDKGTNFSPYSCYSGDSIVNIQLGTDEYDYHCSDWYKTPKSLNKAYWSEPYFDDGGGEIIMSTYSKPLYDNRGKMYAIFTADISLEWFTQLVNNIKPYPRGYNIMISRSGKYLVHHKAERILNETILSATADMKDKSVADIGRAMINQEKGMAILQNDDTLSFAFYAPVERSDWSVCLVCPQDEIYVGLNKMTNNVILIFIVGIAIMLACCYHIVRRQTSPLIKFTAAAQKIAEGDFNVPLPKIRSKDEMKRLSDSFDLMQRSLITYIEELKQSTASKERIESELRIANKIQMGMIPKTFPPFANRSDVDLYASLIPAKEVGGDLYDYFIDDEKLYFTVGDVSGKGIPASLLMAVTISLFRNITAHLKSPELILSSLNDSIAQNNKTGMFVTLFLGIIDLKSGKMEYCNAGHNPPIISNKNESKFLNVIPNIPLGVFEEFEYKKQEIQIETDTQLFVYTDGVTEAENINNDLFSDERLLSLFKNSKTIQEPKQVIEMVSESVHLHSRGAQQSDDITMLCVQYSSVKQ